MMIIIQFSSVHLLKCLKAAGRPITGKNWEKKGAKNRNRRKRKYTKNIILKTE
jgi:hypothetical protein